jgi:hypothetical protein
MRKGIQGVLVLSAFFCIWNLRADELVAHIRGTVTDPSSARVPGAEVVATNTATKVSTTLTTTAQGTFEFLSLPAGTYDVTVSKAGFKNSATRHIVLQLNQVFDLPVSLQLGQTTETVQVEASPVQVETTVTQMGTVIEGQTIVDLPLLGRAWVSLEQLVPGVVAGSDRFSGSFAYATNGSESQQNSFLINGADSMDLRLNTPLVTPSADSIAEFNLIDSTINPEYGRNSGGILNAILKSGSNEFHGTAFEFFRDTSLNTHNFFQTTVPVFHQNQYGGVLSGPIVKQKAFFMFSYQGTRSRAPDSNQTTTAVPVFSSTQRGGFFPDIASSTALSPIPMVAESGATMAAGTQYNVLFPTGHIPVADFNPISAMLLNKYIPQPTLPGNLFGYNPVQTRDQEQGVARIDYSINPRDTIWGSMFIQHDPVIHAIPFLGSTLPGFGEQDTSWTTQLVGAWSHTFNATTLNELRLSYIRFNYNNTAPTNPALPSSFGFTGINPEFPSSASMPYVSVTGFFNLGFSPYGPQPNINNTYQLDDNFSKVHGNHTMKYGFDGRRYQVFNPYEAQNSGEFLFQGAGQYSTSDPGADFLLGIPDTYIQSSGGVQDFRTYEIYLYAQDSWKIKHNLTLNYGTGYQIDTPLENQHFNKLDNNCFFPGQQSSIFPTAPLGLLFPGDQGCTLSGYHAHYDHLAPRIGFAYSPDWMGGGKKFVIRAGFGVYFNRNEEELGLQQLSAAPFSITNLGVGNIGGSPTFANPFRDIATGQLAPNPFPFVAPVKGQAVDFSQFEPLDMNVSNPNSTSPYSMNFNLNVQRELPGSMILQVGYVGSQGRHLNLVYEGNPISPAGQAACAASPACIANRVSQHVVYPSHALYAPGDIFASVGTQSTVGVSSYNSLQISLTKRMSHGLSFQASYTYSHSIDDTSGYEGSGAAPGLDRTANPYNFASYRGDSSFDARQRLVVSYDWQVPLASKRWNNIFSREVLDGWKLAGITTLQGGFPVTIGDTAFRSLTCDQFVYYECWDAPNLNGPVATYNVRTSSLVNATHGGTAAKTDYYFNPNAYSLEPIGTVGNAGRNNFHGPGINNTDLSLIKDIKLMKEAQKLELRLDSFNTFNHTQFRFSSSILSFSDINSGNFGRALSAAPGRVVQLAAKFYF